MGRKKPSKAKKRVKALKQAEPTAVMSDETEWAHFEPDDLKNAPHSFVIYRGKVGRYMKELMRDIRKIMAPFTATNLQMRKGQVLRDYVSISSYFHVSHLCILTRTEVSPYLKVCKVPRGPTLTFRILNYTLSRDVLSSLRKQVTSEAQFLHQPLLIMNNFSSESKTLDLVSKTFQNMFPSININKVRLPEIRRVLLLNYLEEDDTIELRHYTITYKTTGVSKGIKKVLITKNGKIPNLGRCTDIADFITRDGEISESEAEDDTETVGVSQKMGVKFSKGLEEVGIKLVELGPRIKMQLIKIEEGLCDGEVLYHKIVEKTPEEKLVIRQKRNLKKKMKMARKREQELNVEKKKKDKEDHKQRCLRGSGSVPEQSAGGNADEDVDDDVDWYRKEVGEDPDQDTFGERKSRPSNFSQRPQGRKRKFGERSTSNTFPIKRSKFTKVKEKAKLMKKQKQKGKGMQMKGRRGK